MLDLSLIPTDEYTPDTPAEAWHARAVSAPAPFPRGSLAVMAPLAFFPVQLERVLGYSLYFALNFVPMMTVCGYAVNSIYICILICICICICICIYIYVYVYVYVYVFAYVFVYVYVCMCMYVCMYVCMCVYVCMYV